MKFPAGGAAIVQQLYERHIEQARGSDDDRRALTRAIAETFCARFGRSWGTKATTAKHPASKDAIAFLNEDYTIDVWDWQNGATRAPQVRDGQPPTYRDARTGPGGPPQAFIAVPPVDHLAADSAPANPWAPAVTPAPVPPTRDAQLEKLIDVLQQIVGELQMCNTCMTALSEQLETIDEKGVRVHL
jgi:hypothetical protein